ncbi:MAG: chemotaxis-specific protein-glutamate methyltransferase CheB [Bacillota bacterium]
MRKIRVLVVDDSALMRRILSDIINDHNQLELVDIARDGLDALKKIKYHNPDVVTMDIDMPHLNGLETLERLMSENPVPVIMISSHTKAGSKVTMKALEKGAVDFIAKPLKIPPKESITELEMLLPQKIIVASSARVELVPVKKTPSIVRVEERELKRIRKQKAEVIVAIGASTGGTNVLEAVFNEFPADLPAAFVVSQHMPSGFTSFFADRLNRLSQMQIKEAEAGDVLFKGRALVAPGDYHMLIKKDVVALDQGPKINYVRPSIDVMLESLINCSQKVIVIIMTGMGKDGASGAAMLNEYKEDTVIMVQDPARSLISGMPEALLNSVDCDYKLAPEKIAGQITRCVKNLV